MIRSIISGVIRRRSIAWAIVAAALLFSGYAARTASLDAIPDISDPQIIVYVKWARSPQLLESEITEPLVSALVGSPGIRSIRSTSHMGYSFVYVVLENSRQRRNRCSIVSTCFGRSCRLTPRSRSGPMPAAWAGSTSTPSSIASACTTSESSA
jgi:multidrug efflux pump subunit AcrB